MDDGPAGRRLLAAVAVGDEAAVRAALADGASVAERRAVRFELPRPLLTVRTNLYPHESTIKQPFDGNQLLFLWSLFFDNPGISEAIRQARVVGDAEPAREKLLYAEAVFLMIEDTNAPMLAYVLDAARGTLSVGEVVDKWGGTPLDDACTYGARAVVELLLDRGADPNNVLPDGSVAASGFAGAIFAAIVNGYDEIALLLLDRGVPPDAVGKGGCKPVSLAKRYKRRALAAEIARRLEGAR